MIMIRLIGESAFWRGFSELPGLFVFTRRPDLRITAYLSCLKKKFKNETISDILS